MKWGVAVVVAVVVAGCASGCGPHETLGALHPVAATLDVNLGEFAVMGGGGLGSGTLKMTDADGAKSQVNVSLTSGHVGVVMLSNGSVGSLVLDFDPADVRSGNDLLGTYQGVEWNVTLMLGVGGYDLENEQFVKLHGLTLSEVFGLDVGHTWLGVDVAGDVTPTEPAPSTTP